MFRTLTSLGFPSISVCVHNGRSNTGAAGELAELGKSQHFKENTIFNEHPLYTEYGHTLAKKMLLIKKLLFSSWSWLNGCVRISLQNNAKLCENYSPLGTLKLIRNRLLWFLLPILSFFVGHKCILNCLGNKHMTSLLLIRQT